jgi:hypothetical protein
VCEELLFHFLLSIGKAQDETHGLAVGLARHPQRADEYVGSLAFALNDGNNSESLVAFLQIRDVNLNH